MLIYDGFACAECNLNVRQNYLQVCNKYLTSTYNIRYGIQPFKYYPTATDSCQNIIIIFHLFFLLICSKIHRPRKLHRRKEIDLASQSQVAMFRHEHSAFN